ncbi:hypothetical protein A7A08_01299 [Methyloligella halotolerans]|uniref:Sulfotransferase family protein n=1 Tax=Methyloligella halotolerans TaxID=1177755 RepID=A0A1E2S1B2_9HYPH|nr:hypothetical protein [Methyloligella halotolerans]ODA68128.1 hypothetical protein A7A08_01299 [Methyloligella halotolerans]
MLNFFILFHKCGNSYVKAVHKHDRKTRFVMSVRPGEADTLLGHDEPGTPVNVRCRNFGLNVVEQHNLLSVDDARFLVFTRHPASFILSAVKYHLRGSEEWAVNRPEPHLGGVSFTTALNATDDEAERQIIAMTQFESLYERQASFAECFAGEKFMRVRCEELFATADPEYFERIAEFLRLDDRPKFARALRKASPSSMRWLPGHSTGAFQERDPYAALAPRAKDHYDRHFRRFADRLGY